MRQAGFTPRDWNRAPQYTSPGDIPGVVLLDFKDLEKLAKEEEASGSFKASQDGTLAKAPFFLDDLPAAFYRVGANHPDFTPNHNTSERETLVVMKGTLRVVFNHGLDREAPESLAGVVSPGDVLELEDEAVSMQAVSLVDPVSALAVAIYRDMDGDMRPDFRLV